MKIYELIELMGKIYNDTEYICKLSEKVNAHAFVITENIAHECIKHGLIKFDDNNNCYKLTNKKFKISEFGVRKDCKIYIDKRCNIE